MDVNSKTGVAAGIKTVFSGAGGAALAGGGGDAVRQLAQRPDGAEYTAEQATLDAVLEAAFLAAAADGELTDDEVEQLAASIDSVLETEATDEELGQLLDEYQSRCESEGFEARVAAVGQALRGSEAAGAAYVLASGIALLGDGETEDEDAVVGALGEALGLSADQMAQFDAQVEQQMGAS